MDKKQRQQLEKINQQGYDKAAIQMKPIFKQQKTALDELHAVVGMLYIHYAINGVISPTIAQKRGILAEAGQELSKIYSNLGSGEMDAVTDILRNNYEDIYKGYSTILNVPKAPPLSGMDIDRAINQPIDGTLFSDRIWKNKDMLVKRLRQAINNIMDGKTTIDQAGKQIQKIFNVSAYESKRLLETEVTRIQGQTSKNIAQVIGYKKVMWSATFENTCEHCMELDGHVFDIDKVPAIPVHSNCKCVLLPLTE